MSIWTSFQIHQTGSAVTSHKHLGKASLASRWPTLCRRRRSWRRLSRSAAGDPRPLVGEGGEHDIAIERDLRVLSPSAGRRVRARPPSGSAARSSIGCSAALVAHAAARAAAVGSGDQAEPSGEIAASSRAFPLTDGRERGQISERHFL